MCQWKKLTIFVLLIGVFIFYNNFFHFFALSPFLLLGNLLCSIYLYLSIYIIYYSQSANIKNKSWKAVDDDCWWNNNATAIGDVPKFNVTLHIVEVHKWMAKYY